MGDIILLAIILAAVIIGVLYYLNMKASSKMVDAQNMIEKSKTVQTIFVIDKKKEKIENSNLPKAVQDQMPRIYKMRKLPMVKAKVGPQVITLLCENAVYDAIPVKKNVKAEIAGLYIVGVKSAKGTEIKAPKKKTFGEKVKGKFSRKEKAAK